MASRSEQSPSVFNSSVVVLTVIAVGRASNADRVTRVTPAMNIILVGAIALLAINFDLVMATALINFGALVAFTFVNLSVISQFWIREKRNKTLKDHFQYLFLPMCGALTVGALWVNLEESSMVLGLIWAAIGLIYLACVTKSFRNPVPQYEDVA